MTKTTLSHPSLSQPCKFLMAHVGLFGLRGLWDLWDLHDLHDLWDLHDLLDLSDPWGPLGTLGDPWGPLWKIRSSPREARPARAASDSTAAAPVADAGHSRIRQILAWTGISKAHTDRAMTLIRNVGRGKLSHLSRDTLGVFKYIYIYIYIAICITSLSLYIYIYTYIDIHTCIHIICIYIYIYIYVIRSPIGAAAHEHVGCDRSRGFFVLADMRPYATVGDLIEFVWLKQACHGPQLIEGTCVKNRGVQLHRIRDVKQHWLIISTVFRQPLIPAGLHRLRCRSRAARARGQDATITTSTST